MTFPGVALRTALLAAALRESNRCALGRWAARGKQYIVMIRPVANGLVMQQLLYKDEVRPIAEVPIDDAEVKDGFRAAASEAGSNTAAVSTAACSMRLTIRVST